MTLSVDIKVADQHLGTAWITNVAHPETGDHPAVGVDDLHHYSYAIFPGGTTRTGQPLVTGYVDHYRSEGAWELVRRVLNDVGPPT